jgi:hypothetical protein
MTPYNIHASYDLTEVASIGVAKLAIYAILALGFIVVATVGTAKNPSNADLYATYSPNIQTNNSAVTVLAP